MADKLMLFFLNQRTGKLVSSSGICTHVKMQDACCTVASNKCCRCAWLYKLHPLMMRRNDACEMNKAAVPSRNTPTGALVEIQRTMPQRTVSTDTTSQHTTSQHTTSHQSTPHHSTPHHNTPRTSQHTTSQHTTHITAQHIIAHHISAHHLTTHHITAIGQLSNPAAPTHPIPPRHHYCIVYRTMRRYKAGSETLAREHRQAACSATDPS
jgi:hypothetical protein